jgi:hypothetical protein
MALLAALLLLATATPSACADGLRITEAVVDPQADHSESAGGNGAKYDPIPGTGTISSVDELVELGNLGCETLSLTGYTLQFADSSPTSFEFGKDKGLLLFSEKSSLDSLLPGGFVLLGNPPGALNNSISIHLRSPDGELIDTLKIRKGAATSIDNEAIHRGWIGGGLSPDLIRGPITPLGLEGFEATCPAEEPAPVPEPSSLLLLTVGGLTLTAASRAIGRRARRERRRSAS